MKQTSTSESSVVKSPLGLTAMLEATTRAATTSGARRRQASDAIASPATTTCSTGEATLGLNTASATVIATKAAAMTASSSGGFQFTGVNLVIRHPRRIGRATDLRQAHVVAGGASAAAWIFAT